MSKRQLLTKALLGSRPGLAARGHKIFVFQAGLIEASDSSLKRYCEGHQKLSYKQVWKLDGLVARGRQIKIFKIVILDIYTLIPTKSTMLITNMKEFL